MAETPQTPQDDDEAGELRSKLAKRLAFAGVLVALLLGTLTFFDYLSSPQDDSDAQIFTEPVPVAPRKEVSQPVKATDSLPEPPAAPEPEPVVEAPPPPPVVAPAPAPVPATEAKVDKVPDVATEKRPAATSTAAPARPPVRSSSASQSPSVQPAPVTTSRPARPVVEEATYAPVVASPTPPSVAAPTLPSARVTEIRRSSPQVVPPSSIARLFSGFSLQAGVFANTQRAEELHAKLTLSGLPSTLETRVQVGPFRSRQEAEAAQEKLRELGVETVLLAPKSGRP